MPHQNHSSSSKKAHHSKGRKQAKCIPIWMESKKILTLQISKKSKKLHPFKFLSFFFIFKSVVYSWLRISEKYFSNNIWMERKRYYFCTPNRAERRIRYREKRRDSGGKRLRIDVSDAVLINEKKVLWKLEAKNLERINYLFRDFKD